MPTATKVRPEKRPPIAKTPVVSNIPTHLAFSIIKADIGQNLWQLVTYTIQGEKIIKVEKSVEDLREILIARIPDLIGGFL